MVTVGLQIGIHLFQPLAALLRQGLKFQGLAQITQHVIGVSVAQAMSRPAKPGAASLGAPVEPGGGALS